jgi:hypothetical protein
MRRLVILVMAVAMLMTVAVGVAAAAPAERAEVCHVTASSDITNGVLGDPGNPVSSWTWGVIVSVPAKALEAHIAHGDNEVFAEEEGNPDWIVLHEAAINDGLTINSQVACYFEVVPL